MKLISEYKSERSSSTIYVIKFVKANIKIVGEIWSVGSSFILIHVDISKGNGQVHPCTVTEALYRPYGPYVE